MNNKNKILPLVIGLSICLLTFKACNLAPGSYPNAERYEIETSEEALIEAVHAVKSSNSELTIPNNIPLIDGRKDSLDHWYHFYIYNRERNQVMKAWVRGGKSKSKIAFVGVYDSSFEKRWKYINQDFDRESNKEYKKLFEEKILNPVKKIIE
ncbi:hypothetical protein QQ020_07710 [Fulvivirgaceae bacterium BMA12]|uniref:Lipoprotein SmpA/OmlA domain-containing protein n=1 Tax=Agaribacillus aureus TaxID=3051825 RepID=A0ABT8L2F5_9BACT|nr:hypothetical protein [Fulvivirgaceae bacterium BMA12]